MVTVSAPPDTDSEDNPPVTLSHAAAGSDYDGETADLTVRIVERPTLSVADPCVAEYSTLIPFRVRLDRASDRTVTVDWEAVDGTAVVESGGMGLFTVTLAATPSSEREVTVDWTTAPFEGQDAATTGADYTADSGTLTFAPGVRQQRICITIADDGEAEAAEKYRIEFSNASGAQLPDPASVVGTILDDDNPGVTVWPTALTVPEGSESDYTVRLTASPETGVAVTLAMNAPADAEKLETSDGCCEPSGSSCSYSVSEMDLMPEGVVSFGCGNPVALASLRTGDTVLDLGSGAGMDCFLAAREVGANGSVIGVDFTPAMIERAEENAAKLGLENVSFRLGDIEALPIDDSSVDVVMSNCVINLAPDKDAVFAEAFRALCPGGRLAVSDIVLTRPATTEEKENMALLTGCVSGSLPVDEYLEKVRHAGFRDVEYVGVAPASGDQFWFSAAISGRKPV